MEGRKTLRMRSLIPLSFVSCLAAFACLGFQCKPAGEPDKRPELPTVGEPKALGEIKDERVRESSGIAPSRKDEGYYFTHNDSGDSARIFKFNLEGKVSRSYTISNAKAVDWEDMASATLDGDPYLFIGDIGDNAGKRGSVQVYRVPEPGRRRRIEADQILDLRYPDGSHNAETLLVHPTTGDITIVTKASKTPAGVYFLKRPATEGSYTMQRIGEITVESTIQGGKLITGGAWSPDRKTVVLRTYLGAIQYDASDPTSWFQHPIAQVRTGLELQGEAITFSLDGKKLITTSEGAPCPISEIDLP